MRIKSNIGDVTESLRGKLKLLADKEYLLRPVCFDVIDLMTKRIHVDGKASDEAPIGTYSEGYMKVRTGTFVNAEKFSRGKQKGKNKNAGTNTRSGAARPQYQRSADTKVVISLTRQLENDWSVIATQKGYGIGFLNDFNLQKARWTEGTYNKKIFSLSPSETKYAIDLIQDLTRKALA